MNIHIPNKRSLSTAGTVVTITGKLEVEEDKLYNELLKIWHAQKQHVQNELSEFRVLYCPDQELVKFRYVFPRNAVDNYLKLLVREIEDFDHMLIEHLTYTELRERYLNPDRSFTVTTAVRQMIDLPMLDIRKMYGTSWTPFPPYTHIPDRIAETIHHELQILAHVYRYLKALDIDTGVNIYTKDNEQRAYLVHGGRNENMLYSCTGSSYTRLELKQLGYRHMRFCSEDKIETFLHNCSESDQSDHFDC